MDLFILTTASRSRIARCYRFGVAAGLAKPLVIGHNPVNGVGSAGCVSASQKGLLPSRQMPLRCMPVIQRLSRYGSQSARYPEEVAAVVPGVRLAHQRWTGVPATPPLFQRR